MTAATFAEPTAMSALMQSDLYQAMRAEVAKLDSTHDRVDWSRVEAISEQVLKKFGQDLLATAYFVHARHVCGGLPALSEALCRMIVLLQDDWERCSPPLARRKARASALQWLMQRTEIHLAARRATTEKISGPCLAQLDAQITDLQNVAKKRLGDQAPAFAPVRHLLSAMQPPPANSLQKPAKSAPAAVPARTANTASTPTHAAVATDLSLGHQICALAAERRRADPTDASAYRLLRVGLWLHLREPPFEQGGVTRIAPLPASVRQTLSFLQQQQQWEALLEQTETLLLDHRLCLDLQRYAAAALRALGASFAPACQAVGHEVWHFCRRLPTVAQLKASDNSPLADASTQRWLGGLRDGVAAPPPTSQSLAEPKDFAAAPSSHRRLFVFRLDQAEQALRDGHHAVALALYGALHQQAQKRRLWSWEPLLGVQLLRGYVTCLRGTAKRERLAARIYAQLARLDPAVAAAMPD